MGEKVAPVRRSRRAASLTAQVLWNIQIQDEDSTTLKSNEKATGAKKETSSTASTSEQTEPKPASTRVTALKTESFSGPRVSTMQVGGLDAASSLKSNRKRKAMLPTKLAALACDEKSEEKKQKTTPPGCRSYIFPERAPFHSAKDSKTKVKLMASVAPRIKSQPVPITSKTSHTTTSAPQASNPILLLPVSLQGNNDIDGIQNRNVGGLSLVTVQAPPNFFNCLRLNKNIASGTSKQWESGASSMMSTTQTLPLQLNVKNGGSVTASEDVTPRSPASFNQDSTMGDSVTVQLEPLNLKVGRSLHSTASGVSPQKSTFAQACVSKPVTVSYPRFFSKDKVQAAGSRQTAGASSVAKDKGQRITTSLLLRNITQARLQGSGLQSNRSRKPSSALLASSIAGSAKKRQTKCPSPDYDCSSPDVDDVSRNPRHSCNRRNIKLRNKAAPAPGSLEYHEFVEEQRRLLLDIKRTQRAKARAKEKLEAKKSKLKCGNSDSDDRPLTTTAAENFKPQTTEISKHDWEWWGHAYTNLVYCAPLQENGKYAPKKCYPAIKRKDVETGCLDIIRVRDCVFLLPGGEDELSYVAKVTALWEHPNSKEMMMSVIWYYRPEHTTCFKDCGATEDEVYSSKHQDVLSVACVEQRCKVLTYLRFCRMHASLRRDNMWRNSDPRRMVPPLKIPPYKIRPLFPNEDRLDPSDMFYCRYLYDVHSHRVKHKLRPPASLFNEHSKRGSGMTLLTTSAT